jgi:hypothetical protein
MTLVAAPHPDAGSSRRLWIGLALFFALKLAFISIGLWSKDGPRLGDDAYVYLFHAESPGNVLASTPGPESLRAFATEDRVAEADDTQRFFAYRVLMRVAGEGALSGLWAVGALVPDDVGFHAAFWIHELAALIFLTAGLGVVVAALPDLRRLWLSLPLVALAILPGQGLHFLIPSVMALGFGMMAWGGALGPRPRSWLLGAAALAALLCHSIGVAHVGVAAGLILCRRLTGATGTRRALWDAASVAAALALYGLSRGALGVGGVLQHDFTRFGLDLVVPNLASLPRHYGHFLERDPVTAIVAPIGLLLLAARERSFAFAVIPRHPALLLGFGLAGMMVVSSLYAIEEYPGEAQLRFLTPLLVLGVLAFASHANWPRGERIRGALFALLLTVSVVGAADYALRNRDSRWPEIDRTALTQAFAALRADEPVLYLDEDFALVGGFAAGGWRLPAYAPSLLALDPEAARQALAERPPQAMLGLVPRSLRTERRIHWSLFRKARYGFDLRRGGTARLAASVPPDGLAIRWEGPEDPSVATPDGRPCALRHEAGLWRVAEADCLAALGAGGLVIDGEGFVSGLTLPGQPEAVRWPWGGPLSLDYRPGRHPIWTPRAVETDFALAELVARTVAIDLSALLGAMRVTQDTGGVVWLEPVR